jgi:hypothetical protein
LRLPARACRPNHADDDWPAGPDSCHGDDVIAAGSFLLVVAVFAAAEAAQADAGAKPVEIEFDAPEGCSGADAFYGYLRLRTDRVRKAVADEARTVLQLHLVRSHGQVVGELSMINDGGGTDTRKVQGETCDLVVQALSLTAALALDPLAKLTLPPDISPEDAAAEAALAKPEAKAETDNRPESPPQTESTPSSAAPRPAPGFELAVGPVGLVVLSQSFSPGVAIAGRKMLGRQGIFRTTLGLAVAYTRNDLLESPQDAQVALTSGGASVCPLDLSASILTVKPCVLMLAGWLRASGRQMTHAGTVDRSWVSAGLTVRAAAFLGRGFSLELEGGFTAPLIKRRFFATVPNNVVAETPSLSPIVGISLTYGR